MSARNQQEIKRSRRGGRRPGAGRPSNTHEQRAWLTAQAAVEWTTVEDARQVWRSLFEAALSGNAPAARVVAAYLFGLPVKPVELGSPVRAPIAIRHVDDWRGPGTD